MMRHYDEWGGPNTYPHMAAGWAIAGNTPFQWAKQVASNYGGTRNGLIVQWPRRIAAKGEVRSQFHHVIDVAPTVLEAAGLPEPRIVNGTPQSPIEGVSMAYSFADAKAAGRRSTQYFEIMGNRAIYADGWLAGTVHRAPWESKPRAALSDDTWELYNTATDFSLSRDLAAQDPAKLKELQDLFMKEAARYRVLPIDDRSLERTNAAMVGRPDLMGGRTTLTLYPGMKGMSENVFINIKNRSLVITADIDNPGRAHGPILAQGGRFGGWSLYLNNGRPTYTYNFVGEQRYVVASPQPVPAGRSTIRVEFVYEGGGAGRGGVATIFLNDQQVAEGRIERTQPAIFSADEGADVGVDEGTPVSEDYPANRPFTGTIRTVTVRVGEVGAGGPVR
jgi:arylsulfatase